MTRTEMERLKIEEMIRHNKEQEKIGKIGNVVGAVGTVASMASAAGSVARGLGSLRSKVPGNPRPSSLSFVKQNYYNGGRR